MRDNLVSPVVESSNEDIAEDFGEQRLGTTNSFRWVLSSDDRLCRWWKDLRNWGNYLLNKCWTQNVGFCLLCWCIPSTTLLLWVRSSFPVRCDQTQDDQNVTGINFSKRIHLAFAIPDQQILSSWKPYPGRGPKLAVSQPSHATSTREMMFSSRGVKMERSCDRPIGFTLWTHRQLQCSVFEPWRFRMQGTILVSGVM